MGRLSSLHQSPDGSIINPPSTAPAAATAEQVPPWRAASTAAPAPDGCPTPPPPPPDEPPVTQLASDKTPQAEAMVDFQARVEKNRRLVEAAKKKQVEEREEKERLAEAARKKQVEDNRIILEALRGSK